MSDKTFEAIIQTVTDSLLETDYLTAKMAKFCKETNTLNIELGYPLGNNGEEIKNTLKEAFSGENNPPHINVTQSIRPHVVQRTLRRFPNVKNVIAIASGKGGVGKSTVTTNLALALSQMGAKVGILDADIYGPSQHLLLGVVGVPVQNDGKHYFPVQAYGIELNSIGLLVEDSSPVLWRGPLASKTLTQLMSLTAWDDLDYLFVDMPPGTGDIQITMAQSIPVTGAVIVTTPQDVATLDAKRALEMFQKVNVPILGIVENMALFKCPNCGHIEHVFGQDGAKLMSERYKVNVLGSLPLETNIRRYSDEGHPIVLSDVHSLSSQQFYDIAMKLAAKISLMPLDHSVNLPRVETK